MKVEIYIWMVLAMLLTAACKGSDDDGRTSATDECYLTIYVYSPSSPIATRADAGYQTATDEENTIRRLQLWVFRHDNAALVGYLEEENVVLGEGLVYRIAVSPAFADNPSPVDVYALANVSEGNSGHNFNRLTTQADLDAAQLSGDHFGTAADKLVQAVPEEGLPMTGVLKEQPIYGSFPALRIGTESQMATVRLARTVSKLRFLIGRGDSETEPAERLRAITGITLDGGQIPTATYLTLEAAYDPSINPASPLGNSRQHIAADGYETNPIDFGAPETAAIPIIDNPLRWVFNETEVLDYGTAYLRESDKQLRGSITFTTEDEPTAEKEVTFEMSRAGDFTRNHTWTVLVLFVGGNIRFFTVPDIGIAEWMPGEPESHETYNW